jgi:hypothetical protein
MTTKSLKRLRESSSFFTYMSWPPVVFQTGSQRILGDIAVAISGDPGGLVDEVSIVISRFSFVQPGSFARTRHSSLILLIASKVV